MKENHLFLHGYPDIKKQQDRKIATSRITSGMFTQRPSATGGFAKTQRIRDNFFNQDQHGKKKGQYTILTVIYRPIHDTCAVSTFQGLRVSFLRVQKTSFYFPFTHHKALPIINFSVNPQTTCSFAHHNIDQPAHHNCWGPSFSLLPRFHHLRWTGLASPVRWQPVRWQPQQIRSGRPSPAKWSRRCLVPKGVVQREGWAGLKWKEMT